MDTESAMNMTESVMNMIPYLHFTGGDYLVFKALQPDSAGTLTAASIVLICLALVERLLMAARCSLEARWSKRLSNSEVASNSHQPSLLKVQEYSEVSETASLHTVPPFTPTHEILRGFIYALRILILYVLMMAVMTFQAAYLISIVIGSGLGEMIFGRFSAIKHSH
uniref:Copper transport protein n=2 Tax=Amanita strobiliformis TaxID=67730 RepID=K4IR32_9AGAR|nr:copper transport protein CTR2 [Amanita strobiliformis]